MIEARTAGGMQRAAIAACLVIALVGGMELVSLHRGSSRMVELGYFAIPAVTAFVLFRSWSSRAAAWLLLTALSWLTAALVVFAYLTL